MNTTPCNPRVLIVTPEVTYLPHRMGGLASFYTAKAGGLADVSAALRAIGGLTGHESQALEVAREFEAGLAGLESEYGQGADIRVFYQVDARPLYTINGNHFLMIRPV